MSIFFCITAVFMTAQTSGLAHPEGFMENKGQIVDQHYQANPAVKFLFCSSDLNVQLRMNGFSYDTWTDETDSTSSVEQPRENYYAEQIRHFHRVDVELINSNPGVEIVPTDSSATYYNFFTAGTSSEGISDVRCFAKVLYRNIYPGIDLLFFASEKETGVKYDFIVHPGGNISDIRLHYSGADEVELRGGKICVKVSG
ncbi:MAG TPA: hypothetical protein VL651_14645, partial [Bacteroidia bacterium]|nr:hypothetical protein [Bacteroidia bacterium]